jgi:NAD(P)-dependent dehydrogenase (short-subunit alcohol dehydrogenase family)
MRFENKHAIVTGAASGIGRAVAERLAREGASLLLCDWNGDGVTAVAAEIGGRVEAMTLDVSNAEDCDAAISGVADRWGRIDILCNIAGVLDFAPFAEMTPDRWARVIGVNLGGVYNMSRAAMPYLVASRGTIVNMASSAGLVGVAYNAAYTASKHGVVGLTKALALEFAKQGVRINAVCPTGVRTPMVTAPPPANIDWSAVMRSAPWLDDGAMCEPEDIADAVAFLASSEARRITGVAFPVDGGQTAG